MNKDIYTIIKNPSKFSVFPWQVWISYQAFEFNGTPNIISKRVAKCIKTCRTEMQAELEIAYQKDIAAFKEAA